MEIKLTLGPDEGGLGEGGRACRRHGARAKPTELK